jgi:GNAT superfamily N-acetyltransferase
MTITVSTDDDLAVILHWLKAEYDRENTGNGFWCNRNILQKDHAAGELLVLREAGEVVAFQTGRLLTPGILEVRPDLRGRGYGKLLADYCIAEARSKNICFLHIECNPLTSIPFWQKTGFTLFPENHNRYGYQYPQAYMLLQRRFELPAPCSEAMVLIQFYPDGAQHRSEDAALSEFHPRACRQTDGAILLEDRVIGFHPSHANDIVVKITVDGNAIFFDRAKYGENHGVQQRSPAFYIDVITP